MRAFVSMTLAVIASPAFGQGAGGLKEGAGREEVQKLCAACHPPGVIASSSGYTREHWDALTATMIDLSGSADSRNTVLDYLAAQYPPQGVRKAALVNPLRLEFTEWVVPKLGQRARDPVEAPNGDIWWVGQSGNTIGRIRASDGAMKEWALPPRALPHSVNVDAEGRVWYMGNGNGTIGRIHPDTGEITEIRMPDPSARDPHTAEFDASGVMWFTLQQSNMIGRFDPETGEVRLARVSTARSRPYGVKIAADGTPWVAANGSNRLIRVDPSTMALTEIELPDPGTTVRRLDIGPDGVIWYVNSSKGRLGRFDPKTGDIREWPSPSGERSHPYAIAVVDGVVWYNESAVRPDVLVRFDPRTETFASWPVPSGEVYSGIIRHMRPARNGDLLIHQSATNRIMRVKLPPAVSAAD